MVVLPGSCSRPKFRQQPIEVLVLIIFSYSCRVRTNHVVVYPIIIIIIFIYVYNLYRATGRRRCSCSHSSLPSAAATRRVHGAYREFGFRAKELVERTTTPVDGFPLPPYVTVWEEGSDEVVRDRRSECVRETGDRAARVRPPHECRMKTKVGEIIIIKTVGHRNPWNCCWWRTDGRQRSSPPPRCPDVSSLR